MNPLNPNQSLSQDPLEDLAQLARLESVPQTNVAVNVLREIRVQDRTVASRPLMWLALGSSLTATAIAIVALPTFMSLIDPLNALYQSSATSLL